MKSGLVPDSLEKLVAVVRIPHRAGRDGRLGIGLELIEDATPLAECVDHPLHGVGMEVFGLLDALAQPENAPVGFHNIQPTSSADMGDEETAGEGSNIDTGEQPG